MNNTDKLVAAVSEWLAKVGASALPQIQISPTSTIGRMMSGLLGVNPQQYNVWNELGFLLTPTINSFVEPQLRKYLSSVPDESIKDMAMVYANSLITQAQTKGAVNMFGVQLGANAFEGLKGILEQKFGVINNVEKSQDYDDTRNERAF